MKIKNNKTLLILLVITFSGVLIFSFFNKGSFWVDEALSFYFASSLISEIPFKLASTIDAVDIHPPFYYFLLHLWMHIGKTEFVLRFFSCLFGILCIGGMYWLGRILADHKFGLMSAFIFSLSPLNIYYSGEARSYTLLCFLSLLSVCSFLRMLNKSDNRRFLFLYIISTSLCMYTHYSGIFVVVIENIFFFVCIKKYKIPLKRWLKTQFFIWLFYLPWIFVILKHLNMYFGLNRISLSFIVNNVFERNLVFNLHLLLFMLTDIFLSFSSFHYPYNVKIWMAIVFGFLFFKGIYSLRKSNFEFIFLLLYLFFPIIFTYFFIWPFKHVYAIRYFFVFSPPYYIFLSAGLLSLKNIRYKSITILSFYFIFSNVVTLNFLSLHNFPKQRGEDWRALTNYIKEKSLTSDIIIFDRGKMMPPFEYYFKSPVPCIGFVAPKESDGEYREYERDVKLAVLFIILIKFLALRIC